MQNKMKISKVEEDLFFPMSDYPHSTKKQVKDQLIIDGYPNPRYSGKIIEDEKGKVIRGKGFYCD